MNRNLIQTRNLIKCMRSSRSSSNNAVSENEPIKFSTSGASKRVTPSLARRFNRDNGPWYQPFSVVGSLAVFLIYFCIFREENDVDLQFNKSLYDRIKGLEKQQLLQSYSYNKEHGKSVEDIERRLKEIEKEEAKLEAS